MPAVKDEPKVGHTGPANFLGCAEDGGNHNERNVDGVYAQCPLTDPLCPNLRRLEVEFVKGWALPRASLDKSGETRRVVIETTKCQSSLSGKDAILPMTESTYRQCLLFRSPSSR
jgi:hypothetical protein